MHAQHGSRLGPLAASGGAPDARDSRLSRASQLLAPTSSSVDIANARAGHGSHPETAGPQEVALKMRHLPPGHFYFIYILSFFVLSLSFLDSLFPSLSLLFLS